MATSTRPEIVKDGQGADRRAMPRDHSEITPQMETDHFIALANEARRDFEDGAKQYREFDRRERELENTRHIEKQAACLRLKQQENPLTAPKQHTGTSAEGYVETDPGYAAHLQKQRDVVFEKNAAHTRMESARLRCLTAIAALKAIGGWA